ncbi:MAG TPA: transketolase C-terminal domain-containing protein [Chloroflexota bacterium]|nr:transketolase C-terminal domain-containing protein [Chloroflexota bacterium]
MRKVVEGSMAIAEAVKLCRAQVISAYPITPQTHIVQNLSSFIANGAMKAEYIRVESEHSAASAALGASAVGARAYTASSSQGIMLMAEVLFSIAGMRLPVVMTCANRAVSSPINIWNDQQDSYSVRDSGWIQLHAEDNQEAVDLHLQAYKIAENAKIELPVMVCMDGFVLTHSYEPVDLPEQAAMDAFLPSWKATRILDPKDPKTFGMYSEEGYTETRFAIEQSMIDAKGVIEAVSADFERTFGRHAGGLMQGYRMDDAEIVLMATGSIVGLLKSVADDLRAKGKKVGVLKLVSFRPFPGEELAKALKGVKKVAVFEKAVSVGGPAIVASELRSALYQEPVRPEVSSFVVGLGGKDITDETIHKAVEMASAGYVAKHYMELDEEFLRDLAAAR